MQNLVVFLISFHCILLELFLTRILNLKAWNHVVYVVIPFAMLGYGIGANLEMLLGQKRSFQNKEKVLGIGLILTGVVTLITTILIIRLPVSVDYLLNIFTRFDSMAQLLTLYTLFMLPFIVIGYVVVYLFSQYPQESQKLYFLDLVGAGLGALMFYPLINGLAVFPSVFLISFLLVILGVCILFPQRKRMIILLGFLLCVGIIPWINEPVKYAVDPRKGWECIPGYYNKSDYQEKLSQWHSLGRTNLYQITNPVIKQEMIALAPITFDINIFPVPDFSYFSTNFLAGTPVYNLNAENLRLSGAKTNLFSLAMEAPYVLLEKPKVLVIGAGGGRDIFMAKTHGAKEIIGAEINPGIFQAMSKGGVAYEYSGQIYDSSPTKVFNVDGRYIAKTVAPNSLDLIVLNGVDTFSGLSSGAYAYAESYLYTKEAIKDFLKALGPQGMINYNRWLFREMPRESLRLQAIALQALKESGVVEPWRHILVGADQGWSIILIQKTPFDDQQITKVVKYLGENGAALIYPSEKDQKLVNDPLMYFDSYAEAFKNEHQSVFAQIYPFDISVVTDDNPFFYKYYKLKKFSLKTAMMNHHDGTVVFLTQFLILSQAIFFIAVFIFLPLIYWRRQEIQSLPKGSLGAFILYFACLGTGFMFLEIPLMQCFVLLLASPIYSISVVLAALLVSTGVGSFLIPVIEKWIKNDQTIVTVMSFSVFLYVLLISLLSSYIVDLFLPLPFVLRALIVGLFIFPLGVMLGVFFPIGLRTITRSSTANISWAWGINSGFSVLGGILAIIIGQFVGFKFILLVGSCLYLCACLAFVRLAKAIRNTSL